MDRSMKHQAPAVLRMTAAARPDFDIVPLRNVPIDDVLDVLNQSLGTRHDKAWFSWKHLDNPFGRSLGWAAVGTDGLLGVRLFMPWQLRLHGRDLSAVRPVDTATAMRARGRGIFKALTQHAVAAASQQAGVSIIFNTPNRNSRPGYVKMGWSLLPPISHGIWPAWPGRVAQLATDDSVFEAFDEVGPDAGRMSTSRSARVMRWRYDGAAGISYGMARLRQSDAPNGVVYCVSTRRGVRILVLQELVGAPRDRRYLLNSVARLERAWAFMASTDLGALPLCQGASLRRGHSVLAVRPLAPLPLDPMKLDSWALTLGDLEATI